MNQDEKVREEYLPLSRPFISSEEKKEVEATLDSGWLSTGPRVKAFEQELSNYIGAKYVRAVNSCTAGLHLSLVALGIGRGDEVITSPFTFPATVNVILHVGATPVLCDIKPDTYNIDPQKIKSLITKYTKAIIPVHYGGQPCDMDKINAIARENSLCVIEDAATAVGAKYKDKFIGQDPNSIAVFSFYANKVLTTGEGGVVLTGSSSLAEKIKVLSLHGMTKDAWKRYSAVGSWLYEITEAGFKCNMTDLQAALGLVQLKRLEWFIKRRQEICAIYNKEFADCPDIIRPYVSANVRHTRYIYPILIDSIDRNKFIEALKEENIGTSVHYIPVYKHPFYQKTLGITKEDFPVTESVFSRIVSLPLFPGMSDKDAADVIAAVKKVIEYYHK